MKFPIQFLIVFYLFTSAAFAQPASTVVSGNAEPNPVSMTGEQMLAYCDARHGSYRTATVAQCVTGLRFKKAEATDAAIVERLEKGETRGSAIIAAVNKLGDKVDGLAAAPRPATTQPPTSGITYTRTGGAAWAPVHQPTVVSIHSLTGMVPDTLHIEGLNGSGLRQTCGGVGAPLVVFLDHGVPVSNVYAPVGAPTGFVEVYYDKNADGTPDGTVWALDLQSQDDVWITWGLANDLEVRYLRPGMQIAVAGLSLQWVYHPTIRRENPGSGAVGCEKSQFEPRGGHRVTRSMSQVW